MNSRIHAVLAAALISLGASGLAIAVPESGAGATGPNEQLRDPVHQRGRIGHGYAASCGTTKK